MESILVYRPHLPEVTYDDLRKSLPMSLLENNGYLPLGVAVNDQNEAVVDELLQKCCSNIDSLDFYDRTALHYAARLGNATIGQKLLKAGCSIDRADSNGVTALHIASCKGHEQFVKLLLDMGCFKDPSSSDGIRPIHCAAGNGHTSTVNMLLHTGVDVNARGPGGRTALYMAAECGHLDIVQALVNAHARLNVHSEYGLTPLGTASFNNNTEVALCLIRSGARVNKGDSKNHTPLHHAVHNGNLKLVKELLKSGCDFNILTRNFDTPIHIAVKMGHVEVLKSLVSHGCDVNLCEPVGNVTPLHVAVNTHQDVAVFSQILKQLLKGGCVLNSRAFSTLETPLYRALELDKDDIAKLLLSQGADPNLASPFDITALQKTCQRQKIKLAELLVNCGIRWKRERWMDISKFQGEVTLNSSINEILRKWTLNPVPLQKLCRIVIRQTLDENVDAKVQQLPIPKKFKNFLLLWDLIG